jgi:hypothetical protein
MFDIIDNAKVKDKAVSELEYDLVIDNNNEVFYLQDLSEIVVKKMIRMPVKND